MIDSEQIMKMLNDHEQRIAKLEGRKIEPKKEVRKEWYRSGSTIEKIIFLINGGFFNKTHSISEIIQELKSKDYHLKATDLTLPLRKIVRKGLLKKTDIFHDGSKSKKWLYIKV